MVVILILQKREEGWDCRSQSGPGWSWDLTPQPTYLTCPPQMLVCFMCGCKPGVLVHMAVWFIPGQEWA